MGDKNELDPKKWPAWRYGPGGQSKLCPTPDDVPDGWVDHPSKLEDGGEAEDDDVEDLTAEETAEELERARATVDRLRQERDLARADATAAQERVAELEKGQDVDEVKGLKETIASLEGQLAELQPEGKPSTGNHGHADSASQVDTQGQDLDGKADEDPAKDPGKPAGDGEGEGEKGPLDEPLADVADMDRDAMKAELDAREVDYKGNASNDSLAALVKRFRTIAEKEG